MTPGGRDKAAARNGRLAVVAFQRWAESVSGGHRSRRDSLTHTQSETTNCQSESSKFNSCQRGTQKQSTVTSLCFITEHAHIYTLSPLSPTTPVVLLQCLMWSLSPHLTSSFPVFSAPSVDLLFLFLFLTYCLIFLLLLHLPSIFLFSLYTLLFLFCPFLPCAVFSSSSLPVFYQS